MTLNMNAVGKTIGPIEKAYTWKDAVLYALGVGAGFSELSYCYEKDLKVLPSFSIAAIFAFLSQVAVRSGVNLAGILHGEQALVFHHPIPPEGTLTTTGAITHYYDKGERTGALVVAASETFHSNGRKLFSGTFTLFGRLDGGFGGENAPADAVVFPDRRPDRVVGDRPGPNQPLLYRLCGDIFPLHADPEFARNAGFREPIMHGLCTHGYACRALIRALTPGRPERVRRFDCRFSKPLYPDVPIETRIWETEPGRALWRTVNAETGEVVIDNGVFEYGDAPGERVRFDGRVAVVTGAGAGLGRAYALALARRGARVVVNDLGGARDGTGEGSPTPADGVVAEIRAMGGEAVASYDSVATAEGGEAVVRTALETYGRIDVLVNNAGILGDRSFSKMSADNWRAVMGVHLHGAYHVTRPAYLAMRERGYGRIVFTTSAAGLHGNFGQANYAAAKMALVGLTHTLAIEGRGYGVKVNAVAPVAASRLTEDVMPPELLEQLDPGHVAPLVLVLCAEACPVSGNIYNAGTGAFSRSAVVTGPGVVVGDGTAAPAAGAVADRIEAIASLEGAATYGRLEEALGAVLSAVDGAGADDDDESGRGRFQSPAEVFEAMPGAFVAANAAGVDAVFQYDLSGAGGGRWHCTVKASACSVAAGRHERPTCTLKMAAADFLEMVNGALPPVQAFTAGKLAISGDLMASQLIEKLFRYR